jgi:hypothetical protein
MTQPESVTQFSTGAALRRLFVESRQRKGTVGALQELAAGVIRGLRELTPRSRRARFGDLDFDWERNVNTTQSNVSLKTQFIASVLGTPYFASQPYLFDEKMAALPIRFEDFTFIDLGSGKGRTLLMASDYFFKKIIGVEMMPELDLIAQGNLQDYQNEKQRCFDLESLCLDAREFEFPAGPLVVYLFNPFPESVLTQVLEKLGESLQAAPREAWIAYRYPEHDVTVRAAGFAKQSEGESWALYKN